MKRGQLQQLPQLLGEEFGEITVLGQLLLRKKPEPKVQGGGSGREGCSYFTQYFASGS